tara:strand:+ start:257 stop:565 length:309 start_codon:yes stop_codon:yes gene_type:complete
MPIFEYQCKKCGAITESLQKADDPKPPCDDCGSKSTFKVMSNTSFILKGGGWYITDYARKGQKSGDEGSSSASSTKTSSSDSAKSTAKSEKADKKKTNKNAS